MARGWIDKQTNETAAQLKTRLQGMANFYAVSGHSGSTIAYSANGLILRQKEESTEEECRGLSKDAANLLKGLQSDSTTTTIHYKGYGTLTNGVYAEYAAVGIVTGTKVTVRVRLANEAGGWRAQITTVTYSAESASGWSTTRPSAAASSGILTDYSQSSTKLYAHALGGLSANAIQVCALFQNVAITTRDFVFLTESEAFAMCQDYNSRNTGGAGVGAYINILGVEAVMGVKNYTAYKAVARHVSFERGWTVTVNAKAYTPAAYYYRGASSGDPIYWHYYSNGSTVNITESPFTRVACLVYGVGGGYAWRLMIEGEADK